MGEITRVDLGKLSRLVDDISEAASEVADTGCAELDPASLPGSAVSTSTAAGPIVARIHEVAASLREWATAARTAADAFDHTDTANSERFPLR